MHALSSHAVRNTDRPMTDEQIARVAPSIFATGAHESRSQRYRYISTAEVLRGLRTEGFEVFAAQQARCRIEGKADYTKHMIRLRHADTIGKVARVDDSINEIVLINAHDGTSAYKMLAGRFRWVCCNGLVVGNLIDEVKVTHSGKVVGEVVDGAFRILNGFEQVDASVDHMRALQLSSGEQNAFARAALAMRFPVSAEKPEAPITAEQALRPRRIEDAGGSLWETFQRAQENLVQGGVRVAGRGRRHTRAVAGIDGNVALNRGLWVLAEEMRKLRGELAA